MEIFDADGDLHCSSCPAVFPSRGSHSSTDNEARLRRWKVWQGPNHQGAHCPDCAKPVRGHKVTQVFVDEALPGIEFPRVPKQRKSSDKRQIS